MTAELRRALVTGAAGFIGFHLCRRLLEAGWHVVGVDNLNAYYDVKLKTDRLDLLRSKERFEFHRIDIVDRDNLTALFVKAHSDVVVNLAAQAGVRYSLENPHAYVSSNVVGFVNLLECCRRFEVRHLVFASSSSVYGANTRMPFSIHDHVDHPVSLYAATKKANELIAHTYSHLYGLPCTGLRFFTVYGPWGRPDMALFLFTRSILDGTPIKVFNHGRMKRDFTFVDDVVEALIRVMGKRPEPDLAWSGHDPTPATSYARYRIYNIGNNSPVELSDFIASIESALGKTANKEFLDMQPGDIPETFADIEELTRLVGFRPRTPLDVGVRRFVEWYKSYYRVQVSS